MTTDEPVDYERTWHAALEDMDKHGIGSRDRAYLCLLYTSPSPRD